MCPFVCYRTKFSCRPKPQMHARQLSQNLVNLIRRCAGFSQDKPGFQAARSHHLRTMKQRYSCDERLRLCPRPDREIRTFPTGAHAPARTILPELYIAPFAHQFGWSIWLGYQGSAAALRVPFRTISHAYPPNGCAPNTRFEALITSRFIAAR